MGLSLRTARPDTDYRRVAELFSLVTSEPITEEILLHRDAGRPEHDFFRQQVAVDDAHRIVGYSHTNYWLYDQPGRFWLQVIVDPSTRRAGIGSALYEDALAWSTEQGADTWDSEIRDNEPASLRFAEKRGFHIERHRFESRLDIESFDAARFAGTIEKLQADGVRFFTFADTDQGSEAQHKLYDLNITTGLDNPGRDPERSASFEEFARHVFQGYWFRADGQIFAADGERWVGMSAVGEFAPGAMYNTFTGVLREYRGRKIALALKLLAIEFCRKHEARYVRTNNDSQNEPMLAINRKLGYQPEPGLYRLRKDTP